MARSPINLSEKVKLLFDNIKRPDGKQFTYEYLKTATEIEPSTVSRIRSGQNQDPSFVSIMRLAKAFEVSMDYFAADMTTDEATIYLQEHRGTNLGRSYFDELKAQAGERDASQTMLLARRASRMDNEALEAVKMIVDYVLKQKGEEIDGEDESLNALAKLDS